VSNNGMVPGIIGQLVGTRIPAGMSRGELLLLRRLVDEEDADTGEQLTRFVPGGWWIESDNVSAQTCFRLIKHSLISMDGEESGGVSYWRVNEMGRMALRGMTLAQIKAAVR